MLQYHGKPGDLHSNKYVSSSTSYHRGTVALILPERERQARPSTDRSTCQLMRSKTLVDRGEEIQINVSGKRYQLNSTQLQKFPISLLGDPTRRQHYYDAENKEIFFDRNRTAFECVFNFYLTQGRLVFPRRALYERLIADELYFFGVYDYLSSYDKKYNLPVPRRLQGKKHAIPRRIYQKVIWEMCEIPDSSNFARILNLFSLLITMFVVILACVETLPSIRNFWNSAGRDARLPSNSATNFSVFLPNRNNTTSYNSANIATQFIIKAEQFCICWFTVELVVRFIVAPEKRKFLLSVLNIIDIAAIIPFYISLLASRSYRLPVYILKILRFSKIFQILKISRFYSKMKIAGKTAKACVFDLWTMVFLTFIGTVLFGSTVYYCEQWDKDTVFHSIPDACWWAVVTISTLGYGDMVPKTLGKLASSFSRFNGFPSYQ